MACLQERFWPGIFANKPGLREIFVMRRRDSIPNRLNVPLIAGAFLETDPEGASHCTWMLLAPEPPASGPRVLQGCSFRK